VEVVKAVLTFLSYVFHGLLTLFLLALSALALISGSALHLEMLPWSGSTLVYVLLAGSLVGLVTVLLAIRGSLRFLFFLWCLAVLILLVRGYLFSGYRFDPTSHSHTALYLTLGALIAVPGAWFRMMRSMDGRRPRY
jgi:hypothetical protein